jgi:hypothetical protein
MNATTAAIDLAKNVFQVALADANSRVLERIASRVLSSSASSTTALSRVW